MPTATVAVIAVPAELNVDALGHLQVLGLGRSGAHKQRGSHQHRRGCCHGESDLHHVGVPPWAWCSHTTGWNMEGSTAAVPKFGSDGRGGGHPPNSRLWWGGWV